MVADVFAAGRRAGRWTQAVLEADRHGCHSAPALGPLAPRGQAPAVSAQDAACDSAHWAGVGKRAAPGRPASPAALVWRRGPGPKVGDITGCARGAQHHEGPALHAMAQVRPGAAPCGSHSHTLSLRWPSPVTSPLTC
jgi:hypothetical protein